MNSHTEFWTSLDRIAQELAQEGIDDASRAENLAVALETFPKARRSASLAKLSQLAAALPVILTLCQKRDGESS
jgi:hypothetical protein